VSGAIATVVRARSAGWDLGASWEGNGEKNTNATGKRGKSVLKGGGVRGWGDSGARISRGIGLA